MKNILFVYLSQESGEFLLSDEVNYNIQRRPQLGFMYMSSVLKDKANTTIIDQTVDKFTVEELIEKLKQYDLVGFYVADVLEKKVKDYTKKIKEQLKIPIIIGGPGTFKNNSFLDEGCDIVCVGEGEKTIVDVVDFYEGKKKLKDIKGICYKKDNKIIQNQLQDLIVDLNSIPFPDRSKIKIDQYHDFFVLGMRKPYTTIMASRGCPYKCTYCVAYKIWNGKLRVRSVDNVLNEIDEVVKKYGIKFISFQDDVFGVNDKWLMDFCEKLIQRKYDLKWMCILHPFSLKNHREEGFKLMQKAGCVLVSFGIQTAHPQILKNINRSINEPEELQKTIKVTNKLGLVSAISFIFGLPGDTKETIEATIDYCLKTNPYGVNFYNLIKFKGSDIEEKYGNQPVCNLSHKEINDYCVKASKKFYTQPKVLFKLFKYVLFSNPSWFIKVGPQTLSVSRYFGLLKQK